MTELLGCTLADALNALQELGKEPVVVRTSSRKRSGGSDTRVVRVRTLPDGRVELTAADFLTAIPQ